MTGLAQTLDLGSAAVSTTPGARNERKGFLDRVGKVQNVLYTLLVVCSAVDVLGLVHVLRS